MYKQRKKMLQMIITVSCFDGYSKVDQAVRCLAMSLHSPGFITVKKVLTDEKLYDISARLEHSPKKSLRQLARQYLSVKT